MRKAERTARANLLGAERRSLERRSVVERGEEMVRRWKEIVGLQ